MTYWYQRPPAVDALAAAYVLGTLKGRTRHRFEQVQQRQPALQQAVQDWTQRLAPMLLALPPVTPRPTLWLAIERSTLRPTQSHANVPAKQTWWQRWLAPIPAGALAMGLVLGAVAPVLLQQMNTALPGEAQLPASYVGVLGTADGSPGLIVSSLRKGRTIDIKQISAVATPAGFVRYLWRIDKDKNILALGPVPDGPWVQMGLSAPAEKMFFSAVELAVTLEPVGSHPVAPSQAFVYRGLCGKLWR